jgi:uncharacterized phiE125 gp8 family phage protein
VAALTRDEVKKHLNITGTGNDDELDEFTARAEAAIEKRCGPLVATTVSSRVRGGASILPLPKTPVVSLTSITPLDGTALTVADYIVSPGGNVEGKTGVTFGSRWYDVVYKAGHAATVPDVPADLKLAALELVRHLWDTQRGGTARPGSRPSDAMSNTIPGAAYLFPFRVEQLLTPYVQVSI